MVNLRLLGGLAVQNGAEIRGAGGQRKSLLLLALVASSGAGISREKLLGHLWRDLDEERAQNALRQRLFALRRDLGEEALFLGTTDLRLNPNVVAVDLWEFEHAIAAGDMKRAAEAYGGPFLDGIYVPDSPELERWIEEQRSALAARATRVFMELAAGASANGDHAAAVASWRRVVSFDPSAAPATLGLMKAMVDAGDAPGALTHYRTYCSLLREAFELDADPRVVSFAESIRSRPPREDVTPASMATAPANATPANPTPANATPANATPANATPALTTPSVTEQARDAGREREAAGPVSPPWRRILVAAGMTALAASVAVWGAMRAARDTGRETRGAEQAAADSIVKTHREHRTLIVLMAPMPGDSALRLNAFRVIQGSLQKDTLFTAFGEPYVQSQMTDMRVPEPFLKNADSIASYARVLGHALVHANVARFGSTFTVDMVLERADHNWTIATFSGQASDTAALPVLLRQLTDSASQALRRVSSELRVAHDSRATTPEATELLRRAMIAQNNGDYLKAVSFARASLRADSNFVGAWDHLATNLSAVGVRRSERLAAASRAYQLRERGPRSGELWWAARWYLARGILDSAYESERRRANTANFQGGVRRQQREWLLAELESRRMLAGGPGATFEYPNLVGELLNQGKFRDADSVIRVMEGRGKMRHFTIRSYISRAEAVRNYDSAAVYILQSLADTGSPAGSTIATLKLLRATRAAQGRLRESDSIRLVIEHELEKLNDPGSILALNASQAMELLLVRHDTAGARRMLADAEHKYPLQRIDFMDRPFSALISAHALLRDVREARTLLHAWEREVPHEYRKVDARQIAEARGELALAEGKFSYALQQFRTDRTGFCAPCDAVFIARTFDAMGQADSAATYLAHYLDTPATGRWEYDALWLAYAHDRAASIHAQRGEAPQAVRRLDALASLWKRADPELQNGGLAEVKRRSDALKRDVRTASSR